jgi:1-acyl-sn-glycerol-3-phosphate acyltransferase
MNGAPRALLAPLRLTRATAHGLHGLAIVLLRFPRAVPAEREAHVAWWAQKMLRVLGVGMRVEGRPHGGAVLMVANHVSWLDILALHAVAPRTRFVSKADVQRWPLLGRLVTAGGTLYLERDRKRDALRVVHAMAAALQRGEALAVFPEGTTSDGHALLPFHGNLLQAAVATQTPLQPVAIRYSDADAPVSAAVAFVGATTLATSLWRVASARGLTVRVWLMPVRPSAGSERRALAHTLQADIGARLDGRPSPAAAFATAPFHDPEGVLP